MLARLALSKPIKEDIERFYTEKVLAHLGLEGARVSSVREQEQPPDVRLDLRGKVIAVEVMEYHRDWTEGSSRLRRQEARINEIEAAFGQARNQFPALNAEGQVFFRRSEQGVRGISPNRLLLVPGKSEVNAFVTELLKYAQSHADQLTASRQVFNQFSDAFSLLSRYVEKLEIRSYSWTPIWNFDPRAKTHGFAGVQWVQHVRRKAERIRRQRGKHPERLNGYHEIWLVLTAGPRSSQSVAATLDHFAGDNDLLQELETSPFDAVFVYHWPFAGFRRLG